MTQPVTPEQLTDSQRLRTSASWLRSQLLSLQTAIALGPERLDAADTCRALAAIARGEDWREAVRR